MDVSEITPTLLVGTNACCMMHYKLLLIERGVLHDVSLEGENVDAPFGAETYLWLPTPDHEAPSLMSLWLGVQHIREVIEKGGRVYVHCKNGHGRGPTLAAAHLISTGMTLDEAVAAVRHGRPETHLEPIQYDALKSFFHDFTARAKN